MPDIPIKHCSICKQNFSISEFYKNKITKDGLEFRCKKCRHVYYQTHRDEEAARSKVWYQLHRDEVAARNRAWYQLHHDETTAYYKVYWQTTKGKAIKKNIRHKRRSLTKDGDVSSQQLAELLKATKRCYWCDQRFTKKITKHIDHYDPLSKSGKHTLSNLVVACPHCNQKKHADDPIEFAHSVGRLL